MVNIVNYSTDTLMQRNYPGHFLFSSSRAIEGIEENLNRSSKGNKDLGTGFGDQSSFRSRDFSSVGSFSAQSAALTEVDKEDLNRR